MPRQPRFALGGYVYHVLNRANGRNVLFRTEDDYKAFEQLLTEANELFSMRILAYALMSNHWHFLLYPREDNDLTECMRWLTTTHATRFRSQTRTIGYGHVYQGRFKSFLVDTDAHLLSVLKYIERNPVRAKIVRTVEEWRWGSGYRRIHGTKQEQSILAKLPIQFPKDYPSWVNEPESIDELEEIRACVAKGKPYGDKQPRQVDKKIAREKKFYHKF